MMSLVFCYQVAIAIVLPGPEDGHTVDVLAES